MRGLAVLLAVVLSAVAAAVSSAAPTLTSTQTFPAVVPTEGASAALIVARTSEPTTGMRFVYEGTGAGEPVVLQRIAADVFAGVLYGPRLLARYDAIASADRTIPGHFELNGTTGQPFLTLSVDDGSVPDVPISTLAADVRCAPHVLNIDLGGDPWAGEDNEPALRRAYAFLPDAFDNANIVLANPSQRENRHHIGLRNNVTGIGKPIVTSPGRFGSASRLFGLTYYPIAELFDLASPGANHELGHQWINSAGRTGKPDEYLFAGSGSHWPPSEMARGPMGWNLVSNPQGLDFPYKLTDVGAGPSGQRVYRIDTSEMSQRFHPLDLYMMGLVPPAEVPPFAVVSPSESSRFQSGVPSGETVLGKELTIADVVASEGSRTPAGAPRTFSNLSIVVTRTGLLSDRELSFYDEQALRGEARAPLMGLEGRVGVMPFEPFNVATSGRGSLATSLGCPGTPSPRATLPGVFRGLNVAIQTSALDAAAKPALQNKAAEAGQAYAAGDTATMNARLAELQAQLGDSAAGVALRALVTDVPLALAPSITTTPLKLRKLRVTPTPFRKSAQISFRLNRGVRVRIAILRNGGVLKRFEVNGQAGANTARLRRGGLGAGRYTLRVEAGTATADIGFRIRAAR